MGNETPLSNYNVQALYWHYDQLPGLRERLNGHQTAVIENSQAIVETVPIALDAFSEFYQSGFDTMRLDGTLYAHSLSVRERVRKMGGNSLDEQLAMIHDLPEEYAGEIYTNSLPGVDKQRLLKCYFATKDLEKDVECYLEGCADDNQEMPLEKFFTKAIKYNGEFKNAIKVLAAEAIVNIDSLAPKEDYKKKVEKELDIYCFLLELVEEHDMLMHIQDYQIMKLSPEIFDAYNKGANALFGEGDQRRETILRERHIIDERRKDIKARLQIAGLTPITNKQLLERMQVALHTLGQEPDAMSNPEFEQLILKDNEFYISEIREKSIGSLIRKVVRYFDDPRFITIYQEKFQKSPSLTDPETWKYVLSHLGDSHAFRIVLPNKDWVEVVTDYFVNISHGAFVDMGISPNHHRDLRNEHIVDNKVNDRTSRMVGVNVVYQEEEALLCGEAQMMTGKACFDYFHGPANRLFYGEKKNKKRGKVNPVDVKKNIGMMVATRLAVAV